MIENNNKNKYPLKEQLFYDENHQLCLLLNSQGKPSIMAVRDGMIAYINDMMLEYRDGVFYGLVMKSDYNTEKESRIYIPQPIKTGITFTEEELIKIVKESI